MTPAEIRALQALRAPSGIDSMQAGERWPNAGTRDLYALVRRGFAEKIDDTFFITEAGRAACPCRNPLAATPATPPEVFTMPKGETQVTRQQVLDAIVAAGPSGISRKELIKKFECVESIIDNHVMRLDCAKPSVIYKPRPGLLIDIRFKSAGAMENAPEPVSTATVESCVSQTAKSETQAALTATGDTQSKAEGTPQVAYDWVKGPVTHDIHGISLDVDHHEAADLGAAEHAQQMAQIAPARYAVAFAGDFHATIEDAIAQAEADFDSATLKQAVIVSCTPLGRIEVRPVFVPEAV